jgi:hypothetical protein
LILTVKAFLSCDGFGDYWDPCNGESFVGDHKYNDYDNEPYGM